MRFEDIISKAVEAGICTMEEAFTIAACVDSCRETYNSPKMKKAYGTLFVEKYNDLMK